MDPAVPGHAGLIARTPRLRVHSALLSMVVPARIVEVLETKLGIESRMDVRLRLLHESCLLAWRCGTKNGSPGAAPAESRFWCGAGRKPSTRARESRSRRAVAGCGRVRADLRGGGR
jgi:hypothetical protein